MKKRILAPLRYESAMYIANLLEENVQRKAISHRDIEDFPLEIKVMESRVALKRARNVADEFMEAIGKRRR